MFIKFNFTISVTDKIFTLKYPVLTWKNTTLLKMVILENARSPGNRCIIQKSGLLFPKIILADRAKNAYIVSKQLLASIL